MTDDGSFHGLNPASEARQKPGSTIQNFPEYFYTDAFVTKLNPAGTEMLYSTYFGGLHDDEANSIGLDAEGNIIITGRTNADDCGTVPGRGQGSGLVLMFLLGFGMLVLRARVRSPRPSE